MTFISILKVPTNFHLSYKKKMTKPITSSDLIALKVKINDEMSQMEDRILATLRKEFKAQLSALSHANTSTQANTQHNPSTSSHANTSTQTNAQHNPNTSTQSDSNKQLALMFENEKSALMLATNREVNYAIEVYKRETNAKIDEIVKGISQHIIPSIKETRRMIVENVIQDGMESVADYRQSVWKEFEGDMKTLAITDGSEPRKSKHISEHVSIMFDDEDDDI